MASKTYLSDKDAKYQMLLDISKKISPERPFLQLQKEVTDVWKKELEGGTNLILFNKKMEQLRKTLANKKGGIMAFMARGKPKQAKQAEEEEEVKEDDAVVIEGGEGEGEAETESPWKIDNRRETKVQDDLKNKISVLERKVLILIEERAVNSLEGRASILTADIKKTRDDLEALRNALKRKVNVQKNVQKHRERKKAFEERLKQENPEMAKALKLRDAPGRPTIEEDNPGNCFF